MSINRKEKEDVLMEEASDDGEENMYDVEAILEKKKVGGKFKYKVKWVGYSDEECTWEPVENLSSVNDMLLQFEDKWDNQQLTKNKENNKTKSEKKQLYKSEILNKNSSKINDPNPAGLKNSSTNITSNISNSLKLKSKNGNRKKINDVGEEQEEEIEEELEKKIKKRKIDDQEQEVNKKIPKIKNASREQEPEVEEENMKINSDKNNISESPEIGKKRNNSNNLTQAVSNKKKQNSINNTNNNEDPIIIGEDEPNNKTFGSLDAKDVPKKLLTARQSSTGSDVNCLVEWHTRQNGVKPGDSFVSNRILRDICPTLLLDFYESRLRFPNSK